jgi:hypothetical protein
MGTVFIPVGETAGLLAALGPRHESRLICLASDMSEGRRGDSAVATLDTVIHRGSSTERLGTMSRRLWDLPPGVEAVLVR